MLNVHTFRQPTLNIDNLFNADHLTYSIHTKVGKLNVIIVTNKAFFFLVFSVGLSETSAPCRSITSSGLPTEDLGV